MKRLFFLLPLLFLVGCDEMTWDYNKSRQRIVEEFQTTEIFDVPNQTCRFVVRDTSGAVWFVAIKTNNQIESKTQIFSGKNPIEKPKPEKEGK